MREARSCSCLHVGDAASVRRRLQPLALPHRYPQTVHKSTYDQSRQPQLPRASRLTTNERCRLRSLPETVRRTGTLAIAASRRKRVADIRQDVRRVDGTSATTIPQSPQVRAGLTGLAVPRTVRRSLTRTLPAARSTCDACRVSTVPDCRAPRRWWESSREQAHIPAQQSAPQPYPRLSSADADACRARHYFRPASQGPRPSVRLTAVPESLRCYRDC
jgi:hypothetical protein